MCGGSEKDLHDPRRVGALAVVSDRSGLEQDLSGRIVFFNNMDSKSTLATHVKFIPLRGQQIRHDLTLTILYARRALLADLLLTLHLVLILDMQLYRRHDSAYLRLQADREFHPPNDLSRRCRGALPAGVKVRTAAAPRGRR